MAADKFDAKLESDFDGLKWVNTIVRGLAPRWTVELDEDAIKQTVVSSLGLATARCDIKFLAQGAFNKVYVVTFPETKQEVIARVTLPVDSKRKTLSEVATLQWVRDNTSLPVPEVIAYQADRTSAIGFEWIVMSRIPGRSLDDRWRDIAFSAKEEIVRQIAAFCSETFRTQLRGIGSLSLDDTGPASAFRVQQIVSRGFIWGNHIHARVSRGPFQTSRDWILARMSLDEVDCRARLSRLENATPVDEEEDEGEGTGPEKAEDEDDLEELDVEELQHAIDIVSQLRRHLDDFFPPPGPGLEPEPTMIFHDDLSRQNILVDDQGNLTAVVDWECISALPLWFACDTPPLLQGKPRDEEPVKAKYEHDENGNINELFWEHLDEYELTQLRRLFFAEMQTLQPEWVRIFESSQRQRDFDIAVSGCSDPYSIRTIREWLDDLESGVEGFEGLEERIDNASL